MFSFSISSCAKKLFRIFKIKHFFSDFMTLDVGPLLLFRPRDTVPTPPAVAIFLWVLRFLSLFHLKTVITLVLYFRAKLEIEDLLLLRSLCHSEGWEFLASLGGVFLRQLLVKFLSFFPQGARRVQSTCFNCLRMLPNDLIKVEIRVWVLPRRGYCVLIQEGGGCSKCFGKDVFSTPPLPSSQSGGVGCGAWVSNWFAMFSSEPCCKKPFYSRFLMGLSCFRGFQLKFWITLFFSLCFFDFILENFSEFRASCAWRENYLSFALARFVKRR